jgi:acetylornithine aminotransferase
VPFGDAEALRAAVTDDTAAIMLEPIQGEGGVNVPPADYLVQARAIADEHGALLILDEVQTGVGRTGTWLASHGFRADVITLAKGLGGGIPIGAVIATGRSAALFTPGSHGSTFGGNPVSCAAALAVLDAIETDGLMARAAAAFELLSRELPARSHGVVTHVRGRGLLLAAVLAQPNSADVERSARDHGLIVNAVAPDAIRMAPPLVITDADLSEALDRWDAACATIAKAAA